ncbi:MAG: hypothetical protein RLN88_09535 [Ekhidna sp.]|uniref:hypothetical protein n=1 Tax=Ekhidna sp. TaxID=2608089 RepID=UPI0032F05A35
MSITENIRSYSFYHEPTNSKKTIEIDIINNPNPFIVQHSQTGELYHLQISEWVKPSRNDTRHLYKIVSIGDPVWLYRIKPEKRPIGIFDRHLAISMVKASPKYFYIHEVENPLQELLKSHDTDFERYVLIPGYISDEEINQLLSFKKNKKKLRVRLFSENYLSINIWTVPLIFLWVLTGWFIGQLWPLLKGNEITVALAIVSFLATLSFTLWKHKKD